MPGQQRQQQPIADLKVNLINIKMLNFERKWKLKVDRLEKKRLSNVKSVISISKML
jgi:hypothetical protein